MYQRCPKCGYQRTPTDTGAREVCPQCGVIFSKYMRQRFQAPRTPVMETTHPARWRWFSGIFLRVDAADSAPVFWGRLVAYLLFSVWGWQFILMEMRDNTIGASFMHNINLVFHEAGHVIFRLFGEFMTILGGSLFQVLVPLMVMGAFLIQQRNPFAASIALWWTAQSLMDVAPYINDARARQLLLLGGGTGEDRPWMHDWYNIFARLGWLEADQRIASAVDTLGEALILLAMLWGGVLLYRHYRLLRG